jgi:sugar (pentulose or hexulose) kinase
MSSHLAANSGDVYDQPRNSAEHHACIGAALLGGVAAGAFIGVRSLLPSSPPATLIEPVPSAAALYRDQYARYRDLSARFTEDPYDHTQD